MSIDLFDEIKANNRKEYKLSRFLFTILLFVIIYFFSLNLISTSNPYSSLFLHSIIGFVLVSIISMVLIRDSKVTWIIAGSFLLKFILGYGHYILFVDPLYFSHPTSVILDRVTDYNSQFGFLNHFIDNNIGFIEAATKSEFKHPELFWMMSMIFKHSGVFLLTIIPINCISSSLVAVFTTLIAKIHGYKNYRVAAYLTSLLPLSLFSDNFFRDMFGMMLAMFCFVIVYLSKKKYLVLSIILISYVLSLNRMPYIIVPFISLYIHSLVTNKQKQRGSKIILQLLLCFLFFLTWDFLSSIFASDEYNGYLGYVKNPAVYLLFPIKYFTAIVGMFPWTQVFTDPTYYNFSEFFHSASMFYISLIVFPYIYYQVRMYNNINYMSICGILILLMGALSSTPHLGYLSWSTCLFIPSILECFNKKQFIKFHFKYFIFMILLNTIWVGLGFHGSGLGKSIFG